MSDQEPRLEADTAPIEDLINILNGSDEAPAPIESEPVESEPVEAAEPEQPEGEAPEVKASDAEGEPPSPTDEDGKTVPLRALHDERSKRQELERRLEQLEKKREQEPEPKAPDPLDDPEGYQKFQDQRQLSDRIEMSMEFGRELHEDFDDVYGAFLEEAEKNPVLAQQAIQSKAPGLFCYREGQKLIKAREIGDPETYAQRKVDEATAALRKELDEIKQQIAGNEKRSSIPPSLAGNRSASGTGNPKQPTHTPITSILS